MYSFLESDDPIQCSVPTCVLTLALNCIPLLLAKTSRTISRRMRNFLLAYVTFMFSVSTVNTVTLIVAFTIGHGILNNGSLANNGLDLVSFPNGLAGSLCVTFSSWGADGYMVSSLKQRTGCFRPIFNIYSASYGGVRCYMKEFRDLGDWERLPFLFFWARFR